MIPMILPVDPEHTRGGKQWRKSQAIPPLGVLSRRSGLEPRFRPRSRHDAGPSTVIMLYRETVGDLKRGGAQPAQPRMTRRPISFGVQDRRGHGIWTAGFHHVCSTQS